MCSADPWETTEPGRFERTPAERSSDELPPVTFPNVPSNTDTFPQQLSSGRIKAAASVIMNEYKFKVPEGAEASACSRFLLRACEILHGSSILIRDVTDQSESWFQHKAKSVWSQCSLEAKSEILLFVEVQVWFRSWTEKKHLFSGFKNHPRINRRKKNMQRRSMSNTNGYRR